MQYVILEQAAFLIANLLHIGHYFIAGESEERVFINSDNLLPEDCLLYIGDFLPLNWEF